jgi:histidyl-tRNA synthetase
MMLAMNLYRSLGFHGLTFQLNSTGCSQCRPGYIVALKAFLIQHEHRLAAVDRERLQKNALRVLDSKEPGMEALLASAPHIIDFLCEDCAGHLAELRRLLDALEQRVTINFRLVRGIDYYTKTVFEVWAEGIGAQAAVCGGGRYDGLAEAIGGSATPGVGFGSGIERIILSLKEHGIEPPDFPKPQVLIAHFPETKEAAVRLTYQLREQGIGTRLAFAREKRSLKSQLREANAQAVRFAVIVGGDELARGEVTVRPLDERPQETMAIERLSTWLMSRI